jgi:3-hydroxyacyl-[acyl-carrier-protein] dehydratase
MNDDATHHTQATGRPILLDVEAIQRILPHRPPFLLVDRVVEHEQGKRLVAWKSVTMGDPFFVGHFPGHPVMPGVLILEAMAQAAALLAILDLPPEQVKKKVTYLMGIDNARFRRTVVPGDRLELEVEVVKHKGAVWKTKGTARVDGQVAAEAEYLAMLADPEQKS